MNKMQWQKDEMLDSITAKVIL